MLKYILIVVLNLPFVILAVSRSVQALRSGKSSPARFTVSMVFWLIVTAGLFLAHPIYDYLNRNHLTDSSPLTLFDVVEITGIIASITLVFRLYSKNDLLEQRLAKLNREISIRLSETDRK